MIKAGFQFFSACSSCGGSGKRPSATCDDCGGKCVVEDPCTVSIRVPAGITTLQALGITNDAILSVREAGNSIKGVSDSLDIKIKIKPSHIFRREGLDIYSDATITLKDALLGSFLKVETIKGPIEIKVPPGIQPNETRRISGRGIVTDEGRSGNHYVALKVSIPRYIVPSS